MELLDITLDEVKDLLGKNVVIVMSDGKIKFAKLPPYGQVVITTHNGQVTLVEKSEKSLFK